MRIALFGGTFDPVHQGHLLLAESARTSFKLDRVLFIPTGTPPHKSPAIARSQDRLRMLRVAIAGNPDFDVSDWEIRQKRIVYSYETIAHYQEKWPRAQVFFIIGSDMLRDFHLWKKGSALLDACTFLVAERPGVPWARLAPSLRRKARRIEWPAVSFASHEIRKLVKNKKSIRYQVPDSVEKYIRKSKLYS